MNLLLWSKGNNWACSQNSSGVHSRFKSCTWFWWALPCGKGPGSGSGLLLLPQKFSEVILEVVLEDNRLWKPSNPGQEGLVPSDKVTIHSGVILCSWSFRGWCQDPPEVPATPGSILLVQGILDWRGSVVVAQGGGGEERRIRAAEIEGQR